MHEFITDELVQSVIFKPNFLKKQGEKQTEAIQPDFPP